MKIYMTIGYGCVDLDNPIFSLVNNGMINGLRFNISKCKNEKDLKERIAFVKKVKENFTNIEIMLDIPFPGEKIRIEVEGEGKVSLSKGERIYFTNNKIRVKGKRIYVSNLEFFEKVEREQLITYADGEGIFEVIATDREKKIVQAKAINDMLIYTGRSLSFGYIPTMKEIPPYLLDAVNSIQPENLALSFVSSADEICRLKKFLDYDKINILSKVESLEAINNLEHICEVSDIMLARGDLLLNVPYTFFSSIQDYVAMQSRMKKRKLFCATGILRSIIKYKDMYPSQADLIDLQKILSYHPYSVVLNYFDNNIEQYYRAIKVIENMCEHEKKKI